MRPILRTVLAMRARNPRTTKTRILMKIRTNPRIRDVSQVIMSKSKQLNSDFTRKFIIFFKLITSLIYIFGDITLDVNYLR